MLMLGLSLFSLLSHTCTPQGNALLRQWVLSPLQSVQQIHERHDSVAFFLEPGLQEEATSIRGALKKSGNLQTGLKGIRRGGQFSLRILMIGARKTGNKKSSGVAEWKALLQVRHYSSY